VGGQGEYGCGLLNLTCNHLISAYSQPGDEFKIITCGGILRRQCSINELAVDDDGDVAYS